MPGNWEVRGLFGNEYAMENAVEEIKRMERAPEYRVLDRRNLQVVLSKDDSETRELVKNIIKIAHGFVEADAPFGEYDRKREELRRKKLKENEEKRKRQAQQKH